MNDNFQLENRWEKRLMKTGGKLYAYKRDGKLLNNLIIQYASSFSQSIFNNLKIS